LKTAIFGTDKKRAGIWRDFCSTGSIRKYLKIKDNNKRYFVHGRIPEWNPGMFICELIKCPLFISIILYRTGIFKERRRKDGR
jgi:hypothetical protein